MNLKIIRFLILLVVLLSGSMNSQATPNDATKTFVDDREIPPEPSLNGSFHHATLIIDGLIRSYHYYQPAKVKKDASLVIVLHGSMSTGPKIRQMFAYDFDRAADKHGFIVVYPDGFDHHWNDCRKAAPYQAKIKNINDLGFIDSLIKHFVDQQQLDSEKAFVAGFSNGGQMALKLFLERPKSIRAVAALNSNLPVAENFSCNTPSSGSVPSALFITGTADPVVPYIGGEVVFMGKSRGHILSAEATITQLRISAGIKKVQAIESALPDINKNDGVYATEKIWKNGKDREVRLLTQHGAGHTLAHPEYRTMPSIAGNFSRDFSEADYIWSFFNSTLD